MSKRSDKISKIVALAKSEEQRQGVLTGKSRRHLEEQLARLGELNAYRHSYAARSKLQANVSSAHWKDYQNFLQRLDSAVASQQKIVKDSELRLEVQRRRWLAKRQRLESLQKVLDRYRDEEGQHRDRQLQRALDDLPTPPRPYGEGSDA